MTSEFPLDPRVAVRRFPTALIVCGGGFQGLAVLRGIRQHRQAKVCVADSSELNVLRYLGDSFHVVPRLSRTREFVAALVDIVRREVVDVVFPATQQELLILAQNREYVERAGARIAVPPAACLTLLLDKLSLLQALRSSGLPVLPICDPLCGKTEYPLIGKPRSGDGGKGVVRAQTCDDIARVVSGDELAAYVWQPLLETFSEISVDFSIGFDLSVSKWLLRRRTRTAGGFAVVCETVSNPNVRQTVERVVAFLRDLQAIGVFNVQLLCVEDECFVSDVNPRTGTSAPCSYALGANPVHHMLLSASEGAASFRQSEELSEPAVVVRHLVEKVVRKPFHGDVRGVVFDFDDTLIDQKEWVYAKVVECVRGNAPRLPDEGEVIAYAMSAFEHGRRGDLFDAVCEHFGLPDSLRMELIEDYRNIVPSVDVLLPGVLPTLSTLKQRGYALGLVTDNPPRSQRQKLEAFGLETRFDAVVFSRDLGAEKPAGVVFERISQELGLAPSFLVMTGDDLYRDVAGALRQGFLGAYHTPHPSGLFSFSERIFRDLHPDFSSRVRRLERLSDMLMDLPGTAAGGLGRP